MDTERIVRALAAKSAPVDGEFFYCHLCNTHWGEGAFDAPYGDPAEHKPECPWRLAREWVAANPA